MNSYFSTFITGFSEVVREAFKKSVPDVKIDLLLDGLVAYRTDLTYSAILKLRFFNNTFALLHFLKKSTNRPFSEMRDWVKDNDEFGANLNKVLGKGITSLKLIFVEENQYIHLDNHFVDHLMELVTIKTHISASKQDGDQELWFLVRKEGYLLIGLRLNAHPDYEKVLQKGELKPELSHLLCMLSEPFEDDVFLDPFAGSGAIALERSLAPPFKRVIALDNNPDIVQSLKTRFKGTKVEVYEHDAINLKMLIGKNQIDKIVTDPPWGLYGEKINIGSYYPQILEVFHQVLKTSGILVLLVSRSIDINKLLISFSSKVKLIHRIDTLVNGQKASVYKIQKVD